MEQMISYQAQMRNLAPIQNDSEGNCEGNKPRTIECRICGAQSGEVNGRNQCLVCKIGRYLDASSFSCPNCLAEKKSLFLAILD